MSFSPRDNEHILRYIDNHPDIDVTSAGISELNVNDVLLVVVLSDLYNSNLITESRRITPEGRRYLANHAA